MNKNEFVNEVYSKTGLTKKDCKLCLDAIIDVIKQALVQGESVTLSNFGRFKVSEIKSKPMYNFKTKSMHIVDARKSPTFKPSVNLRQSVR